MVQMHRKLKNGGEKKTIWELNTFENFIFVLSFKKYNSVLLGNEIKGS